MTQEPLQPWERINWSPEHVQSLYRDWGLFYKHKQQLDIATTFYDRSLELKPDDVSAMCFRSMCKRFIAKTESALEDSLAASKIDKFSEPVNLELCAALYELNQFENCRVELLENTRRFAGKKVAPFKEQLVVVDENLEDSMGPSLSPFILNNEKHFAAVLAKIRNAKIVDDRPLWKILRERKECDVVSIIEKKDVLLSPREISRRERAFKVFNQIYYNKTWVDVFFLKHVRNDPHLLLPQYKHSAPMLGQLTNAKYGVVKRFLKMLQARNPLYNVVYQRQQPDKKMWERHREAYLNRVQFQTRRNMFTILRLVKRLRALQAYERLIKYVEDVMGDYVVLKTLRVMPWKFEFVNEVYNTLALAYIDQCTVPQNFMASRHERLLRLLRVPRDKTKDRPNTFVFGDKSTYQESEAMDYALLTYKKYLMRLERRLYFAQYPIEKCYLLYEISRSHLHQNRFDKCIFGARRAIEMARMCNNLLWEFLSHLQICKAHAVLHKVEREKECLDQAFSVAKRLDNIRLMLYVDACRKLNDEDIALKKLSQSTDSMRKNRSKQSMSDRVSQILSQSFESLEEAEMEEHMHNTDSVSIA